MVKKNTHNLITRLEFHRGRVMLDAQGVQIRLLCELRLIGQEV